MCVTVASPSRATLWPPAAPGPPPLVRACAPAARRRGQGGSRARGGMKYALTYRRPVFTSAIPTTLRPPSRSPARSPGRWAASGEGAATTLPGERRVGCAVILEAHRRWTIRPAQRRLTIPRRAGITPWFYQSPPVCPYCKGYAKSNSASPYGKRLLYVPSLSQFLRRQPLRPRPVLEGLSSSSSSPS